MIENSLFTNDEEWKRNNHVNPKQLGVIRKTVSNRIAGGFASRGFRKEAQRTHYLNHQTK